MKVEVKVFAVVRQLVGAESIEVELPDDAAVGDLRRELLRSYPELASVLGTAMFAVNNEYATGDTRIIAGAEIAVIPPVSGG